MYMAKKREKSEIVPLRDFWEIRDRDFERAFEWPAFFGTRPFRMGFIERFPRADLIEEDNTIKVKVDLPGVSKDRIKVNIGKDSISVRADTEKEEERKGKNYYYRERSASGYYRRLPLPSEVDAKSARAKFSNGTLEITVNKAGATEQKEVDVE